MDKIKTTADLIIKLNQYDDGELPEHLLLQEVCSFYNKIKNKELTPTDMKFLYYVANKVGIPQYFDMLEKFNQSTNIPFFDLTTLSSSIYESTLYTSEDIKLHRFQKRVLDLYTKEELNRYFLSATTSFGKTFLVYEIIRKMKYRNILLIFPTIALLSENINKIYSDPHYSWIKETYCIHTISNVSQSRLGEYNIFLYTPERYLSFLDFNIKIPLDFAFVDEIYKIDNEYIIDEEMKENERDCAYRIALFCTFMNPNIDVLLAGPYIEFSDRSTQNYNASFDSFLSENKIVLLNYNSYEIVNKNYIEIKNKKQYQLENYVINISSSHKSQKYRTIVKTITNNKENVIVYCQSRSIAERYAKQLVEDNDFGKIDTSTFDAFLKHLSSLFKGSCNWIVVKALQKGIGIHHGLIPKYIQKEIINLFNRGIIRVLLSTTTITEGVNTTAKNILILSHKKGSKPLKTFDALNIAGRAGRFLNHYEGNILILDSEFSNIKNSKSDPIKHKNYDKTASKNEIDIFYTNDIYLNPKEIKRKDIILKLQTQNNIPSEILEQYKVISREHKIQIYQRITALTVNELKEIRELIAKFQKNKNITYKGIETIISIVLPVVRDKSLRDLMTLEQKNKPNKILTALLYTYFKNGFKGMVEHNYLIQEENIDVAIRNTAKFVYNTLKYQVVKYFGVFNLMYKYYISTNENIDFKEVIGIDSLLLKMEYNANSEKGRLASDYGVPQRIIDYYDSSKEQDANKIRSIFDSYEEKVFLEIKNIIEESNTI